MSHKAPIKLESDRLVISRFLPTEEHAEFLVKLYNTPEFIAGEGNTGIDTTEKGLKALHSMSDRFDKYGHGVYVVSLKDTSTLVGSVSLMIGDYRAPDIGFALLTEYTKKGYATEAAKRVMQHAKEDLGYDGVFGFASPTNEHSRKALERLGMEYRGTFSLEAFGNQDSVVYTMQGMGELEQYGIKGDRKDKS
ncbi:acyl-CoA N-acyltransferase [Kockovaella imperatae]|uniref:Acyl-CoA N-acyltransferase n=1 Tax=Kockovaella imperatae TaxID=4999 RepID=A0A1Y1U995_9TREE|nr:acyl-CoA N-acyltransferase [Kockovaella imperatae]ORX34582.1 acyl-CoA N-acyltransferase [Kockovaella imperatae]